MTALIFELDGTLLDTIGDLHRCTNYALEQFGFPCRSLEEVNAFVGNGLAMLIRRAVPAGTSEEVSMKVLEVMKAHYAHHYCDLTLPYPGIMDMLEKCKETGIPMAIVSNKADPFVKSLHDIFFRDLISTAIGEAPTLPRKPAPDMVYAAMEALGVSAENAYYVGDSEVDVLTARNAGLPCLSVTWGFRTVDQLLAAGATDLIHSPEELLCRVPSR
jgi:phosphoglycolate phosphatase